MHAKLCVHALKKDRIYEVKLVNNCTYNAQSHYVKTDYIFLQKYARHFFAWLKMLDQKREKSIARKISKLRKTVLPIFYANLFF